MPENFNSGQLESSDTRSIDNRVSRQSLDLLNQQSITNRTERSAGHDKKASSLQFSDIYESTVSGGSDCKAGGGCSWRPDAGLSTQGARQWAKQAEEQRNKPLETEQGEYTVQRGDTLNDIARRALQQDGHKPSKSEVDALAKDIAQQNKDKYAILDCNPDLIRPGMKLDIPGQHPQERAQTKPHELTPQYGILGGGAGDSSTTKPHELTPQYGILGGGAETTAKPQDQTGTSSLGGCKPQELSGLTNNPDQPSGSISTPREGRTDATTGSSDGKQKPFQLVDLIDDPMPVLRPGWADVSVPMPVLKPDVAAPSDPMPILRPDLQDIKIPLPSFVTGFQEPFDMPIPIPNIQDMPLPVPDVSRPFLMPIPNWNPFETSQDNNKSKPQIGLPGLTWV